MTEKVVLTCAITGSIHIPSMSEYLPANNQEIIQSAIEAAKAGASVVHIHAREENGKPSNDIEMMREIYETIKKEVDVVVCMTTGASTAMTVEERLQAVAAIGPELASANAGSMNFDFSAIANIVDEPKHDWEIPYVKQSRDTVFMNTFQGMETYIKTMEENGTKPEFEVYDVAMINNLAYFQRQGLLNDKIYLQFVMGIQGGIPASIENLLFLKNTAERQLGKENIVWSVAAAGRHQFDIVTAGMLLGGNTRIGLEDNLYLSKGVLSKSNAESVKKMKNIIEAHDREVATPAEARDILGLKK
ncbi:3-keto-5-aminohexanoate cleavage protein [Aerococcaceae bacterium DSM 111022]|nr:3-keto-5-aminohexanoate cleavage protein [Aerococcaceae bacterium DSM 111022]